MSKAEEIREHTKRFLDLIEHYSAKDEEACVALLEDLLVRADEFEAKGGASDPLATAITALAKKVRLLELHPRFMANTTPITPDWSGRACTPVVTMGRGQVTSQYLTPPTSGLHLPHWYIDGIRVEPEQRPGQWSISAMHRSRIVLEETDIAVFRTPLPYAPRPLGFAAHTTWDSVEITIRKLAEIHLAPPMLVFFGQPSETSDLADFEDGIRADGIRAQSREFDPHHPLDREHQLPRLGYRGYGR